MACTPAVSPRPEAASCCARSAELLSTRSAGVMPAARSWRAPQALRRLLDPASSASPAGSAGNATDTNDNLADTRVEANPQPQSLASDPVPVASASPSPPSSRLSSPPLRSDSRRNAYAHTCADSVVHSRANASTDAGAQSDVQSRGDSHAERRALGEPRQLRRRMPRRPSRPVGPSRHSTAPTPEPTPTIAATPPPTATPLPTVSAAPSPTPAGQLDLTQIRGASAWLSRGGARSPDHSARVGRQRHDGVHRGRHRRHRAASGRWRLGSVAHGQQRGRGRHARQSRWPARRGSRQQVGVVGVGRHAARRCPRGGHRARLRAVRGTSGRRRCLRDRGWLHAQRRWHGRSRRRRDRWAVDHRRAWYGHRSIRAASRRQGPFDGRARSVRPSGHRRWLSALPAVAGRRRAGRSATDSDSDSDADSDPSGYANSPRRLRRRIRRPAPTAQSPSPSPSPSPTPSRVDRSRRAIPVAGQSRHGPRRGHRGSRLDPGRHDHRPAGRQRRHLRPTRRPAARPGRARPCAAGRRNVSPARTATSSSDRLPAGSRSWTWTCRPRRGS